MFEMGARLNLLENAAGFPADVRDEVLKTVAAPYRFHPGFPAELEMPATMKIRVRPSLSNRHD